VLEKVRCASKFGGFVPGTSPEQEDYAHCVRVPKSACENPQTVGQDSSVERAGDEPPGIGCGQLGASNFPDLVRTRKMPKSSVGAEESGVKLPFEKAEEKHGKKVDTRWCRAFPD